ncbi:TetR/AcrR family transcriptional regulator [Staphylococcus succinus]|uniref:TetR/AcrR family transcriptional regulator n=1 Tax=Staphylococcus succinus TaxID=61015 RepID=A0A9Q6MVF0_9STAP|nr:TetR/AcrR family transcriptional regulator [Staphylococcus succinus]MEB8127699.1 TetR/AcrR family transcriptional regulator [Staphylococcus succinus]PTI37655.1 TetR/AcrR family transcriptional regulator [Staphylococcus succinus]PTI76840.1 TetR/AcrR family transcriptional regulator [Staphylococcus succinus]PTJ18137.1 TetR/AcrR family transcriptional regulator [Staphylococcus succinus]RIN29983.1 TetR/AcrR family transcriptional regulator [Staphylococcus succinus]
MAEKVKNLRMTHTKQSLINAFFSLVNAKDFEKITIADIAKGAQVNRATFYAHFEDKYDLIDYIMEDFATASIENYIPDNMIFNQKNISQLILAVHDFYQEPNIECRSSYAGLALPQMREKILSELNIVLAKSLKGIYVDNEKEIFVPIFAQMVHEGALQLVNSNSTIEKESLAKKIASFIIGRF